MPRKYELEEVQVVFNPKTLEADHLLCRLSIAITDSIQNKPLPILGGGIDLRIGHNGKIIGFFVRWRPLISQIQTNFLPYKPVENEHDIEHHAEHEHDAEQEEAETKAKVESEPVLVYELCGESSLQTHLCPYYYVPLGHHNGLLPASSASFVIVFSVENNEQNTVVSVHINGGSGDFTYEWSYLKVELTDVKDVVSAGTADTCTLKGGVFNVLLIVKDKKTGIVKQKMETIYARNNQIEVPKTREIRGCTDPLASNYNPNANSDDGSCVLPPVA